MLRVMLLGNLGSDPEMRYTSAGVPAVTFRVAVNQIRKGPDGERQENTEWFRVHVSGPKTEYAKRFIKGNRVMVEGRLSISHFQGRDGEPRTGFDVWADEFEGMSPRPRDAEALDTDSETSEPALAGVSSLAGSDVSAPATGNGNGRAKRSNQPGASGGGATAELEDLPF